MKRTGPKFRALVNDASGTLSRLPRAVLRLAFVVGIPACCCVFGFVRPLVGMHVLKPQLEAVCARPIVGRPAAEAVTFARGLGLDVYSARTEPRGDARIYVERRLHSTVWYCVIEQADGVVRSKRSFGRLPGD